jgi:hypothetical protein
LPNKRIAARCGFGSEETMRRSFVGLLASTPAGLSRQVRLYRLNPLRSPRVPS